MKELHRLWLNYLTEEPEEDGWWKRKLALWERQQGEIIKVQGKSLPYRKLQYDNKHIHMYHLYLNFLIKQNSNYHIEEQTLDYRLVVEKDKIINHEQLPRKATPIKTDKPAGSHLKNEFRTDFDYDRREAVRYAERWWNSYNPEFEAFSVDCTNYISQCLLAGGAPMWGAPDREAGWWYQNNNWSFSWAVAHSMRWYLSGSAQGLQASETENPEELLPGDVICYDFEGDGRWDHTTIVVRHDAYGMPLVNAHTDNSRNRYWTYEDSAAWTPNIQYKFFRIGV